MGYTVTPSRRRLAMAAMLALAMSGAIIRKFAPSPSTLHDVGTLLLVMWLPAVGNLIAYFVGKIPRSAPPATDFAADAAFAPQLQLRVEATPLPADTLASLDPAERRCTVLVGRRGFTGRFGQPVAQLLATQGEQLLPFELLHPRVALKHLAVGTDGHLLAGRTAVARAKVVA
jgi:hypothetical protein